jgi:hypothetical protein
LLMVAVRVFKIKVNLLLYIAVFSLLITLVFERSFGTGICVPLELCYLSFRENRCLV